MAPHNESLTCKKRGMHAGWPVVHKRMKCIKMILILSYLMISHHNMVNSACIYENYRDSSNNNNSCASDLNTILQSIHILEASLYKNNLFQAIHDHQRIQEAIQQSENSCCLHPQTTHDLSQHLQSIELISEQIDTFLSTITTKIQNGKYLLLRVVTSMELEQLQTTNIIHLDTCIASSLANSNLDVYKNHTKSIQRAFAKFKAASLLLI